jgi:hypothetical protein
MKEKLIEFLTEKTPITTGKAELVANALLSEPGLINRRIKIKETEPCRQAKTRKNMVTHSQSDRPYSKPK